MRPVSPVLPVCRLSWASLLSLIPFDVQAPLVSQRPLGCVPLGESGNVRSSPSLTGTPWQRPEPQIRGLGFRPAATRGGPRAGSGRGRRGATVPEMAPPAGGTGASAEPSAAAVLLTVHAAVRPLGAGPDAEAPLRRLQLSADPERPGRFWLELLGEGPGAVSSKWPLESVGYTVRGPSQHELQPPPAGSEPLSLHFPSSQEAQQWAALVQGASAEGQNGNNCPPALGPEASPAVLPSSPEVPTSVSQIKADQPWSPGDLMAKEELAGRLTQAIQGGDKEEAAQVAAMLAQQHVALSVQLQESCFSPGPIRLQVTVEDAASSAHVTLQVHPHCTVAALQEQVFSELGFPPAVQRWVIGRRLCMPECSLASYGVCRDGDPAFLYLLSAPQEATGRGSQHREKTDGELGPLFPQSLGLSSTPQLASASLPSPLQPGWSCPSCTYINTPSRPGCEMCSTQRPVARNSLSKSSTLPPAKVMREDGLSLPGPSSLHTLPNLSRDLC